VNFLVSINQFGHCPFPLHGSHPLDPSHSFRKKTNKKHIYDNHCRALRKKSPWAFWKNFRTTAYSENGDKPFGQLNRRCVGGSICLFEGPPLPPPLQNPPVFKASRASFVPCFRKKAQWSKSSHGTWGFTCGREESDKKIN